jgi:UDP-N-acetylglucosamine 1-carboxyvinyltransferase
MRRIAHARKSNYHNIPDIIDVNKLIEVLQDLGVKVEKHSPHSYTFQADQVDIEVLKSKEFRKKAASLRGSVMIMGPLLARFGMAYIPQPGGDKIGRRRLDTHFTGFQKLGAKFDFDPDYKVYRVDASKLLGAYMLLDEASVTGTANI